jgi:hypothetical protein
VTGWAGSPITGQEHNVEQSDQAAVKTINDILQIQALKARYCGAVDRLPDREAEAVATIGTIFAEDVEGGVGNNITHGRDALIAFLVHRVGRTKKWLWHSIHTPLIEVEGDSATARWTAYIYMMDKDSSKVENAIGRYSDIFRRTQDGWRMSSSRWIPEQVLNVSCLWLE